jgi:hypothetical protein
MKYGIVYILTKRYGIKWFENGYHDWEDLSIKHRELQEENEL